MVKIGDSVQCPQCKRMGRVVWISKNGTVIGVQCSASHCIENTPDSHGFSRPQSKSNKNSVFLVST